MRINVVFGIFVLLACISLVHAAGVGVPGATGAAQIQVDSLYQDPNPAHTGEIVEVHLRVQNVGGEDASNFQIQALNNYPFTAQDDSDASSLQSLGTISSYDQGNNYVTVKFRLLVDKDAHDGQYDFNVQYRKNGEDWTIVKIPIDVASNNFAQIVLDKASLEPGQQTQINFVISNTGSAPIQNLVFSWTNPDGVILPVFSDDTKYVKYLDVGGSTTLTYTVLADVNANPGLYKLNLNLKYDTVSNVTTNTVQTVTGIAVGGQTDFDVAFSESTAGQTSLSVANIGNNPALSVSVRVPDQQGYRVSGSPTAIVGNLAKGDYTIVSFQIVSSNINASDLGNVSGTGRNFGGNRTRGLGNFTGNFAGAIGGASNGLIVDVDYTDTTGVRQTVEKTVPIQFRGSTGNFTGRGTAGQASSSSSILTSPVFIVIVLVAVAGGVWYWRKHRKVTRGR